MGKERMRLMNIMVLEAEKSKVLFRVICFVAARWMDKSLDKNSTRERKKKFPSE